MKDYINLVMDIVSTKWKLSNIKRELNVVMDIVSTKCKHSNIKEAKCFFGSVYSWDN